MTIDGKNELDEAVDKLGSLTQKLDEISPSFSPLAKEEEVEGEGGDSLNRAMLKHFEPEFDQLSANRLQNILEMDLPRPKALLSQEYESGQNSIAGQFSIK